MICPNCGAPLPDTANMCYSCRIVFQQPPYYNIHPTPKAIKQPLDIKDFIMPIVIWVTMFVFCFLPFLTFENSVTKEIRKVRLINSVFFMTFFIILFVLYFSFMLGNKKTYKNAIKLLISTFLILLVFLMLGFYPKRQNEVSGAFTSMWGFICCSLLLVESDVHYSKKYEKLIK